LIRQLFWHQLPDDHHVDDAHAHDAEARERDGQR
jgi:hypothetical protein